MELNDIKNKKKEYEDYLKELKIDFKLIKNKNKADKALKHINLIESVLYYFNYLLLKNQ